VAAWSDTQLPEQLFEVEFVDRNFSGLLPGGRGMDQAFVKGQKQAHFGNGVFFAAGERAAILLCPGFQSRLSYKDFEGKGGLAVCRDHVDEFAAGTASPMGAIPFIEIVLINEAVGGGVSFDAAHGVGTRHERIIEGLRREVKCNAGVDERPPELKQLGPKRVPNGDKFEKEKMFAAIRETATASGAYPQNTDSA
jgi:hypothetical protein